MALTDNLVSYWKLDESSDGSGAVTRDDAHSTNDLTDNNTTPSGTGKINNGANFAEANTEYLAIADASQTGLDVSGDLSMQAWIKPANGGANRLVVSKANGSGEFGFTMLQTSVNSILSTVDQDTGPTRSQARTSGTVDVTGSVWTHVVVTFNASNGQITIYFDGSSQALNIDTTNARGINNNAEPFSIASSGSGGNSYNGLIDEVGIWSRVLTGTEVGELYNSGAGLAYPFTPPSATTVRSNFLSLLGVGS